MTDQHIEVAHTEAEKDLGVIMDSNLSFDQHIGEMVNKANRMLGLIKRNFKYINENTFLNLYKSLVRPLIEYASPVWNTKKIYLIKQLEGVQRRGTKLIPTISNLSYPDRLRQLNLATLEFRRLRTDLIQVYKIFSGHNKIDPERFFMLAKTEGLEAIDTR